MNVYLLYYVYCGEENQELIYAKDMLAALEKWRDDGEREILWVTQIIELPPCLKLLRGVGSPLPCL